MGPEFQEKFEEAFSGNYVFIRFFKEQHNFKKLLHLQLLLDQKSYIPQKQIPDVSIFSILKLHKAFENEEFVKLIGISDTNHVVLFVNDKPMFFNHIKGQPSKVEYNEVEVLDENDYNLGKIMRHCINGTSIKISKL